MHPLFNKTKSAFHQLPNSEIPATCLKQASVGRGRADFRSHPDNAVAHSTQSVRLAAADRRAKLGFGRQQQERHAGWDYYRDLGQTRTWKPRNTESSFYAKALDDLRNENLDRCGRSGPHCQHQRVKEGPGAVENHTLCRNSAQTTASLSNRRGPDDLSPPGLRVQSVVQGSPGFSAS